MRNGRSEKLDKLIDELVNITFKDGDIKVGVLEYGIPHYGLESFGPSHEYSLYRFNAPRLYFKKSHVKRITKWQEPALKP